MSLFFRIFQEILSQINDDLCDSSDPLPGRALCVVNEIKLYHMPYILSDENMFRIFPGFNDNGKRNNESRGNSNGYDDNNSDNYCNIDRYM